MSDGVRPANKKFSDVDRELRKDDAGDLRIVRGIDDLEQVVVNILTTRSASDYSFGERYMRPEFGSRLFEALGEPMDAYLKDFIRLQVELSLRQDDRIQHERTEVEFFESEHSIIVTVFWSTPFTVATGRTSLELDQQDNTIQQQ